MAKIIPDDQAKNWSDIAQNLKKIEELISECQMIMLLKLNRNHGKAIDVINKIADSVSGQSYMFTPQTEWIGGDSQNPKNFKPTIPHIANDVPLIREMHPKS